MDNNQNNLQVSAKPEDLMGRYANIVSVTSQEREVVIDFLARVKVGTADQASLVSRIFLNRFTAQELIDVLKRTLDQWEKMRYEHGNTQPAVTEKK